jgi:hypothetical protein
VLYSDYPEQDFDITYPVGTEVEDTLQNIEYLVGANRFFNAAEKGCSKSPYRGLFF